MDTHTKVGKLGRYLLFVATSASDRKVYISSFDEMEEAVAAARKLQEGGAGRWQVMDNRTNAVVAEEQGVVESR